MDLKLWAQSYGLKAMDLKLWTQSYGLKGSLNLTALTAPSNRPCIEREYKKVASAQDLVEAQTAQRTGNVVPKCASRVTGADKTY